VLEVKVLLVPTLCVGIHTMLRPGQYASHAERGNERMNCPESVRAEKGGQHCEQFLRTHNGFGLYPFSWLTVNILFTVRWVKHRMTAIFQHS